jgi:glycosyltransferase involved in cell wall biosynthesis
MWVEKIVFQYSNKVYTVSGAIANWFEEKYQKPVFLVRNMPNLFADAIEINSPKLDQLPEGKFILYQGALNESRGIELLLEALVNTNYQLVLVGEGDLSSILREKAYSLGLSNQVYFLGFVIPAELPSVTKRAFIGYNVSQNMGLSYYYSLNNKFFDYVGSELPSVINDFPEYTKLLSEYQVGLLSDYTIESIRAKLDILYQDENIYLKIKTQCKLAKTKWNWQEESKQLLKLYANHER